MKRELPQIIDLDFLPQVAEAGALSSKAIAKRVKPSIAAADAGEVKPQVEGVDLAALIGDGTPGLWPKQQRKFVGAGSQVKRVAADGAGASRDRSGLGSGSGVPPPPRNPIRFKHGDSACFKCGKLGHWARDCDGSPIGGGTQSQSSEPQKACPVNTEKNRGRGFYKCPVKEENGGRGFFEWCDNASGAAYMPNMSSDSRSGSQFPDILCPCGAGPCLILTVKTGSYAGHQFYRCPIAQRPICGFFRWCNLPASAGEVHNSFNYTSTKSHGTASGLSCFKCGQGHWAANCTFASRGTGNSSAPGSRYKCGKENGGRGFFEWCDNASGAAYMPNMSSDSRSGSQFPDILCPCGAGPCLILTVKTGSYAGHQFYRCPITQRPICGFFRWCNLPASAGEVHNSFDYTSTKSHGTTSGLSCFKCGQGHWAANCTSASRGTGNSSAAGSRY